MIRKEVSSCLQFAPHRSIAMFIAVAYILTAGALGKCQQPSKTVRMFSSAKAGYISILSPTISEVDSRTVVFFTKAKRNLETHSYKHFSEIPFVVIFLRPEGSGVSGEGKLRNYQLGTFLFEGKLGIASDNIEFEYSIAQIESESEVITQDYLSISLVRETRTLLNESLDLDNGRVFVVDTQNRENITFSQRNAKLPSPKLLTGVWDSAEQQFLRNWIHEVPKVSAGKQKTGANKKSE